MRYVPAQWLVAGSVLGLQSTFKENIKTTLVTVVLLQVTFLRGAFAKAWSSNQTSLTRRYLCFMEWNAYLFNHLVDFLLPHEQNRGRENTLEEFVSDTFIDSFDTLVFYDRENTVERRLVFGVTSLKPALHNTKSYGENSPTRAGKARLTYTGTLTQLQL